jgi:hypothetical protein
MTGINSAHILCGLDSMALCVGLGPLHRPWPAWLLLASAFGLADGAGGVLGGQLTAIWPGASLGAGFISPAVIVATYGALVLVATARVRAIATRPFVLALMPILFGLDNLATAAATGDGALSGTAAMALTTATLALAGCWLGSLVSGLWPASRRLLPGGAALAAAAIMRLS